MSYSIISPKGNNDICWFFQIFMKTVRKFVVFKGFKFLLGKGERASRECFANVCSFCTLDTTTTIVFFKRIRELSGWLDHTVVLPKFSREAWILASTSISRLSSSPLIHNVEHQTNLAPQLPPRLPLPPPEATLVILRSRQKRRRPSAHALHRG